MEREVVGIFWGFYIWVLTWAWVLSFLLRCRMAVGDGEAGMLSRLWRGIMRDLVFGTCHLAGDFEFRFGPQCLVDLGLGKWRGFAFLKWEVLGLNDLG